MLFLSLPYAYAETRDKVLSQLVTQYVSNIAVLLDHPLIRLQQYSVRQRDKVRRENSDDVAHAGNSDSSRVVDDLSSPCRIVSNGTGAGERDTCVVPIGVHSLGVEALLSLLLACFYVLADPDVAVQPKY